MISKCSLIFLVFFCFSSLNTFADSSLIGPNGEMEQTKKDRQEIKKQLKELKLEIKPVRKNHDNAVQEYNKMNRKYRLSSTGQAAEPYNTALREMKAAMNKLHG